ncbi:MAG: BNR-4 repeat-containing protein [Candidatus Latescibacterota bacterium]
MNRLRVLFSSTFLFAILLLPLAAYAQQTQGANDMPLRLGGCGGVYFYAPKGELWVEVSKQDLNRGNQKTHLRAILFGPDRTVLDEKWIADDGRPEKSGPGPIGKTMLRTKVGRPGVYGMMITVSEDRYGDYMSWGFRTNCPKYLVETSRGHKDARHEEPLVFRNPDREGDVSFLPQEQPFSIEAGGIAPGVVSLPVFDSAGKTVAAIPVSDGKASHTFPADASRAGAPWRLHLPKAQAALSIDGVTRWSSREPNENLSLWTPDPKSWFDFHGNRWLLTPYRRTVYAGANTEGSVEFTLHNNGPKPKRIALSLEFDRDARWSARLSATEITLDAGASQPVKLAYTVPKDGKEWSCFLRATARDESQFSTWSSVTLRRGAAPAESPLALPLKLEPYRHENEQLGYLPDYPLDSQVYFDRENRPFITAVDGVYSMRSGAWVKTVSARRSDGSVIPLRITNTRVAFDRDNDVYCLGSAEGGAVLLHSRDRGATFTAWPLPGRGTFDIEAFSGHNTPSGPPPVARFIQTAADPKNIWRRINDFDLFLPEKAPDGSLRIGAPVNVSRMCIGLSIHSGIPNVIVSRGDKVHVTWGEATDPAENAPGVPTYVATYDRTARALSKPALVGYGPPANDIHNTPCITMDSKGYLHVLVGTHGRAFKYARSLAPDRSDGGWTSAEDVGPGLLQTYVGMVCGPDDVIHLTFRLWRDDDNYFPAGHYATLGYMSKRPGEPWSEPRILVAAPFSEYSIFYHRLTIDRAGALFLSHDYWSTFWFYRTDHRGNRRTLITSPDGGKTWRLARGKEDMKR